MKPLLLLLLAFSMFAVVSNASTILIPGNGPITTIDENPASVVIFRAYGQRFVVPTPANEDVLTDFEFTFVHVIAASETFDYRAYVYLWDAVNVRPTGSPLYVSDIRTVTEATVGPVTFSGLNLELTPGLTYIAFLSTSGVNNSNTSAQLSVNSGNVYPDGGFVSFVSSATDTAAFTNTIWGTSGQDMAFEAHFADSATVVPEGSSFGCVVAGIAVLAAVCRRRLVPPPPSQLDIDEGQ